MSSTMLDLNGEAQKTYSKEPVPPLRKIWIGFALAFAFLVAEFFDVAAGGESPAVKAGLFGAAIAGWFYWLTCVQRFHTILNQISPHVAGVSTYPITPGQAVGYHFIPIYNFIWFFKWPVELSRFLRKNTSVWVVPGSALGLLSLLGLLLRFVDGFLGLSVIFCVGLYISRKLREAVAEHERLRDASEAFT